MALLPLASRPLNPLRDQAIARCLDQQQAPATVAADLGVAPSTLRGWLRWARLERELISLRHERDALHQRQQLLVVELRQAAAALATVRASLSG